MSSQKIETALGTPPGAKSASGARLVGVVAILVTIVPALGALEAGREWLAGSATWFEVALLAVTYSLTLIGVEVGFHRLIAHRGLVAVPPLRAMLAVLGSMTAEGPVVWWVALHRRHHERSDEAEDPHSPHRRGGQRLTGIRGFAHSHVGWMWRGPNADWTRYARDLLRDPLLMFVHRSYAAWVALGLLLPAAAGGWWYGDLHGAMRGFVWGGLTRIFLVHQAMWCVASVCHLYGSRPYPVSACDRSTNNAWICLPTFGESWHNNHHAFPTSARHGLEWWQVDINYLVIRALALLGLVRDVRVPSAVAQAAKRREPGQS